MARTKKSHHKTSTIFFTSIAKFNLKNKYKTTYSNLGFAIRPDSEIPIPVLLIHILISYKHKENIEFIVEVYSDTNFEPVCPPNLI